MVHPPVLPTPSSPLKSPLQVLITLMCRVVKRPWMSEWPRGLVGPPVPAKRLPWMVMVLRTILKILPLPEGRK